LTISQPAYSVGRREFTYTFFPKSTISGRVSEGIGSWGNHLLLSVRVSVDFTASVTAAGSEGEHPTWQSPVMIVHLFIKSGIGSEQKHREGQQTAL